MTVNKNEIVDEINGIFTIRLKNRIFHVAAAFSKRVSTGQFLRISGSFIVQLYQEELNKLGITNEFFNNRECTFKI
jgi:subtilase family serine protease